jgi:hypothetical protein
MPIAKKTKIKGSKEKVTKKMSPFKDKDIFEQEIRDFANKFKVTVVNQTSRISNYFEMSCYNYIVHFYELKGYTVNVKNLQSGQYRYKCSTSGIQSNFSNFEVMKNVDGKELVFEIHHNLAVQSSHDKTVFTTPDISVIKSKTVKNTKEYYDTKTTFSYVENKDFITFCEVKQFNPFPELIFNFIGVLNELKNDHMTNVGIAITPSHLAPSLMISGKPNKQTKRIKESLESRYWINIIYDLFYTGSNTFSKGNLEKLKLAK